MKFLHTRFKVRDLERAIAFYTTHLGFEVRTRHTSGRGSQLAHLRLPGSDTELELAYLPWDPDFQLAEDILHIAFEVDSVVETVERMRAAGVKITEEPHGGTRGHMAFIEDPDGYEIELLDDVPALT
ncbi:MAG: VOC family protein [bacterium]|nr:VOC family protein [bacterium]